MIDDDSQRKLDKVVNEHPFEFHELKHQTTHDERNDRLLNPIESIILHKIRYENDDVRIRSFTPFLWNMQRTNGLKLHYEHKVKSPLGEIIYFKTIFQTLLYDIE